MKQKIILLAAFAAALALPLTTLAATYQYVDSSGNVESEQAVNSNQALISPVDIGTHSGVILISVNSLAGDPVYEYVNTKGALETEDAANATTALIIPTNIASDSGVIIITQ